MKILKSFPCVLDAPFYQDCSKRPSMAIPGLSLTMDKIVAKTASGGLALTPAQQNALYGVPDKTFADYSPDVRDMTLAERARVRDSLRNEVEQLTRKIESDKEAAKTKKQLEQEKLLREQILAELSAKDKKELSEK